MKPVLTQTQFFRRALRALAAASGLGLSLAVLALAAGCARPAPVISAPVASRSGTPGAAGWGGVSLVEFPVVEESEDNPDHPGFLDRVPVSVARQQGGLFGAAAGALDAPNRALAAFDFRLAPNPGPPFTGSALYRQEELLARDIARFWPVERSPAGSDFRLRFETFSGEQWIATREGVSAWPGLALLDLPTQPVQASLAGQVAYAFAGTGAPGPGLALDQAAEDRESFGFRLVGGQPFYFYLWQGEVRLSYAGSDLAYFYDHVVHDQTGELAVFNPGVGGSVLWFFARRDGLWYYVELSPEDEEE